VRIRGRPNLRRGDATAETRASDSIRHCRRKSNQLHLYIEPGDEMRIRRTLLNAEPSDAEVLKLCRDILSSIEGVTPEEVGHSVDIALKEHFDRPDHMVQPSYYHGAKRVRACRHEVGLISLRGTASEADRRVQLSLTPLRGSPLCEA
jgi:hypothetical protein